MAKYRFSVTAYYQSTKGGHIDIEADTFEAADAEAGEVDSSDERIHWDNASSAPDLTDFTVHEDGRKVE